MSTHHGILLQVVHSTKYQSLWRCRYNRSDHINSVSIREQTITHPMGDAAQTIRIFISSPGDVTEERDGARRVIEGLQRLYPKATLQAVLWEDLALPATASFQETIDFLLDRQPIDIAVFILWSRLGSPLGASIARTDGTPYRSGTEREFDLMLAAFEQSGRKRPVILAYARDDDGAFKQTLTELPTSELEEFFNQRKLAEAFIREQFHDAEGRNLRAYQTYREPVGFVQRLRLHLRQAIDDLLQIDTSGTWTEEPYRGLETFDLQHAPIFYGREEETCALLQRLRDQEQAGCAFVVIVGASGSGKSSLARAGVAASLVQHAGDDQATQWHAVTFLPSLEAEDLCAALVRSIARTLPNWNEAAGNLEDISESLAENAPLTVRLSIAPAFAHAGDKAGRKVRLLIILDQLEELWTDQHTTSRDRERFLAAIEALARSGHVAVLATLRSDFYHHAQQTPTFLKLKGDRGHYDLLAPDPAAIHRLITEPARQSGLRFEQNEQTGRSLDEVILEDASRDPNGLPLLEYTLSELYRQRDGVRRMMTFAAYVELGGVEGAIGKRADETFDALPWEARAGLEEILPLLVSVDVVGEQAAVRRRASVAELTSSPARKTLTERLIAARFLTTDRQDDTPIASLAHEALLRRWDRVVNWINANREQLRIRARVEQTQQRWEQQGRDDSLLLAEGVPLDDGRKLLDGAPHLLSETTLGYVRESIAHDERKAKRSRRLRRTVLSTFAALLMVMVVGGVFLHRTTTASELVKRLRAANTSAVPGILSELADYPALAHDELTAAFEESPGDSDAKLHAALALLSVDDSVLPFLKDRLLNVAPTQFPYVRDLLKGHKSDLTGDYWRTAKDTGESPARRFQAACVLASYDIKNDHWHDHDFAGFLAGHLVGVAPSALLPWRNALRGVKDHLAEPLAAIYRDDQMGEQVRGFATDTLADYLSDDAEGLFDLLADANETQFRGLFDKFAAHGEQAIEIASHEINRTLTAESNEVTREATERLSKRQANAAAAMARLGEREELFPVLRITDDPESLTQFVHRCRGQGVNPIELLECLELADQSRKTLRGDARRIEDRVLFGLLLALGEFELDELPSDQTQSTVEQISGWYRDDPSSTIHGASGWLLRQWGQNYSVRQVDETALAYDPGREWFTLVIEADQQRFYQTYVVIPPGEYDIGSPRDEPGRDSGEAMNRVRLTHPVAILDREVTRGEFDASVVGFDVDQYSPTAEHPMVAPSWYDSVQFCRWLTKKAGFVEADQAYLDPAQYPRDGETDLPKDWPLKLEARGFRLPTEAEWEIAARGGMGTMYGFGSDETLLDRYAWFQTNSDRQTHIAKELRPNLRGLFDMHGSVFEWCHDWHDGYPLGNVRIDPVGSSTGSYRVVRGGSWVSVAALCRTAYRNGNQPTRRGGGSGLRVALVPVKLVAEPESVGPEGASGAAT